jgi:hypothetical protein
MSTAQIVREIGKLPLTEKLRVVEQVLHHIRQEEEKSGTLSLAQAAELLLPDYLEDTELTAFTTLDAEDFYEAK